MLVVTCGGGAREGREACAYACRGPAGACFAWSARVQGGDGRWFGDLTTAVNAGLGGGEWGGVDGGACAAGEGDGVDAAEFGGDAPPGRPGAAFGDADEQQRQPADQDVGADAVLKPVEDGA